MEKIPESIPNQLWLNSKSSKNQDRIKSESNPNQVWLKYDQDWVIKPGPVRIEFKLMSSYVRINSKSILNLMLISNFVLISSNTFWKRSESIIWLLTTVTLFVFFETPNSLLYCNCCLVRDAWCKNSLRTPYFVKLGLRD